MANVAYPFQFWLYVPFDRSAFLKAFFSALAELVHNELQYVFIKNYPVQCLDKAQVKTIHCLINNYTMTLGKLCHGQTSLKKLSAVSPQPLQWPNMG